MRWPWNRNAEFRRLLQQLAAAEARAVKAEERLEAERLRSDQKDAAWANRFLTSQVKTYALTPEREAQSAAPPKLVEVRNPFKDAEREEYGRMAIEQGDSRESGYDLWERKERGERLPYEMHDQVS